MSTPPIVAVDHLTKQFVRAKKDPGLRGAIKHLFRPDESTFTAVDDVSFAIEAGESVAYVGPNGAGKSTTVKLLTGILVPTSGDVSVCGIRPFEDRIANARNISVVFGQRTQLWWDIPVIESFRLLGDIYEVPAERYRTTLAELSDVLDLGGLMSVPARQLSLGQRMRCDLAAALIHSPRVLYLDEPTIGLDVAVKARFREFIRLMHGQRGLTVMLTSHDLGDIEELCPRMIMIDRGRIVYDGAFADVTSRFGWEEKVVFTLADEIEGLDGRVTPLVADMDGAVLGEVTATSFAISFDNRQRSAGDVIRQFSNALPVTDIAIEKVSAESIVRQLYEGALHFDEGGVS